MKNHYTAIFVIIPAFLLILAFTEGPPAGYTGSPLDGQNCTACHGILPAGNLTGWISSNIPPEGYMPGETYTVAVTAIGIAAVKMGFQLTSENQVEKAGTFVITDLERTQLKGATTVTHTDAGTQVTQLPATWSVDWVAPATGSGNITFYTAVNQSNNNNTSAGDLIFVSSLSVSEAFVGIIERFDARVGNIYPNPVHEYFTLSLPVHSVVRIFNVHGQEIMQIAATGKQIKVNASLLRAGIYFAQISNSGEKTARSFVKQ